MSETSVKSDPAFCLGPTIEKTNSELQSIVFKMPCRWETCLMISTKKIFLAGPGLGTLKKPKYHYMVVWGLLVQELETLKDLKAEKG